MLSKSQYLHDPGFRKLEQLRSLARLLDVRDDAVTNPKIQKQRMQLKQDMSDLQGNILIPGTDEYKHMVSRWSKLIAQIPRPKASKKRRPELDAWMLKQLSVSSRKTAKANAIFRAAMDYCERVRTGDWYPWLVTLTCRPGQEAVAFAPGLTGADNPLLVMVRKLENLVLKAKYGRGWTKHRGEQVVSYHGVMERGKQTGKLHYHAVFLTAVIPYGFTDPNIGRPASQCIARSPLAFETLWPYSFPGLSEMVPMRAGKSDRWSQAGWKWRFDREKQQEEPARDWFTPIFYLAKYLSKEAHKPWRRKQKRNAGYTQIRQVTRSISTLEGLHTLHRILQQKHLPRPRDLKIPLGLVKTEIAREICRRMGTDTMSLAAPLEKKRWPDLLRGLIQPEPLASQQLIEHGHCVNEVEGVLSEFQQLVETHICASLK